MRREEIVDMKREEIVDKLFELRRQSKELSRQLNELDHENRFQESKKYLGKYFIEKQGKSFSDVVRCLFVYDINKDSCEPMCIGVSYWKNISDSYFNIEYYGHFNPEKWEEEDQWEEITRAEFIVHYTEAQKRISECVIKNI
jgi:hypothetical protein